MKFAVVILACVAAASAQFNTRPYNRNTFGNSFGNPFSDPYRRNQYRPTPAPYRTYAPIAYPSSTIAPVVYPSSTAVPAVRYQSDDRNAQILKYGNEANPDGSYNYFYETDNGIAAQEQGSPRNFGGNPPVIPDVAQGSFSWISPEGQKILITYVADENGYQPSGDAIPTAPPVPPLIARALAYLEQNGQLKK